VDRFELLIDPASAIRWPGGGGFKPVEVRINGRPLLDLIREAEEPRARAENATDPADPDTLSGSVVPGAYLYPGARTVLLPSREWLGSPAAPGFVLDAGDPRRDKAMVLGCTCGISECWFVQARIDVGLDHVRWSEFGQFHRPHWRYDLGPFTFDRAQYEAQLAPRPAEPGAAANGPRL